MITDFDSMGLQDSLLRGVYAYGFESPSVIQQKAIIPLGQGIDLIAQSQSGTGKTAAFGVGCLMRMDEKDRHVQALILEPTRELANQSANVIKALSSYMEIGVYSCTGGVAVEKDRITFRQGVQVVVGTPGRILDLIEKRILDLDRLKMLVLDEADEMLSLGFLEQIQSIIQAIPESAQIGLFSATLPPETLQITDKFMKNPMRIMVQREHIALSGIRQYYVDVGQDQNKLATLIDLYESVSLNQSVIFVNSRKKCDWLAAELTRQDFTVVSIHSDLSADERKSAISKFREAQCRVLIATDLIARGLDVQGVSVVVNFDMTRNLENYIHRIGRAGRFGRKGVALNFITSGEWNLLKDIIAFYNTQIDELPSKDFAVVGGFQ